MGDMAELLADWAATLSEDDIEEWHAPGPDEGRRRVQRPVRRRLQFMSEDAMEEVADVTCIGETPKAVRVMLPAPTRTKAGVKVWVPRSLLGDGNEVSREGDRGTLVVARWFAEKEGLG